VCAVDAPLIGDCCGDFAFQPGSSLGAYSGENLEKIERLQSSDGVNSLLWESLKKPLKSR
jgi:hypothetical protein